MEAQNQIANVDDESTAIASIDSKNNSVTLSLSQYSNILAEIKDQPRYRTDCDIAADYYDGKQLDAATLQAMKELGMAPIIENLVSPTIDAVTGLEAKTRKDWKVTSQNHIENDDLADALNQKLNEAEKTSHADRANSEAFKAQCVTGIGWVEVSRETDPFKNPYRVEYVTRNEMFWDMKAKLPDKSDSMWMMRSRWYDVELVKQAFPKHADVLDMVGRGWQGYENIAFEGGVSTGLSHAYEQEQTLTIEEQEWRNTTRNRVRLNAVWYKRYVSGYVFRLPNGAVAEFNEGNPQHIEAVTFGTELRKANFSKLRMSWWVGPHCIGDVENPYSHGKYPYVPFIGKEEDMTGIPYGLVRHMIPMQDEINARNTKSIWLLAAKRITMTEGATVDDIEIVRQEAGRPDAVHVLNSEAMRNGGVFKVETDFALHSEQYRVMGDKRVALKAVAGVYAAFEGSSNNQSGVALHAATEQSSQTLATIYDNYEFSRSLVGELLLSLVIEDIGNNHETVVIKNQVGGADKTVEINKQESDGSVTNAISMIRAKVALSDVPTTSSFRSQTLQYLSTLNQGLPPQYQGVLFKLMMKLTDISGTDKAEILEQIAKINGEQVNKPPKNEQEAAAQQQMAQKAMMLEQMQIADAKATLELKQAQAQKAIAEAKRMQSEAATGSEQAVQMQSTIDELEKDLNQAAIEFDTSVLEIQTRKETALEVARIQAQSRLQIAQLTSQDKAMIASLEAEQAEIEQLLGFTDSQASDTANVMPA